MVMLGHASFQDNFVMSIILSDHWSKREVVEDKEVRYSTLRVCNGSGESDTRMVTGLRETSQQNIRISSTYS